MNTSVKHFVEHKIFLARLQVSLEETSFVHRQLKHPDKITTQ